MIDHPARAIDDALLFYEVRIQRILRALEKLGGAKSPVSAWQIWERLFPKADRVTQMRTRMLMVIGGLDWLEREGAVEAGRRDDGAFVYRTL